LTPQQPLRGLFFWGRLVSAVELAATSGMGAALLAVRRIHTVGANGPGPLARRGLRTRSKRAVGRRASRGRPGTGIVHASCNGDFANTVPVGSRQLAAGDSGMATRDGRCPLRPEHSHQIPLVNPMLATSPPVQKAL